MEEEKVTMEGEKVPNGNKTESNDAMLEIINNHKATQLDFIGGMLEAAKNEKNRIISHGEKLREAVSERVETLLSELSEWEEKLLTAQCKLQHPPQPEKLSTKNEADENENKLAEEDVPGAKSDEDIENADQGENKESSKPQIPPPVDVDLFCNVKFDAEDTLNVGEVAKKAMEQPIQVSLLWCSKAHDAGVDAAFSPEGALAVTDGDKQNVTLYDGQGNIIANTLDHAIQFEEPQGIVYYPERKAFLVSDLRTGELLVLDGKDLTLQTRLTLPDTKQPTGLALLSDNRIVVANRNPGKVTIYEEKNGKIKAKDSFSRYRLGGYDDTPTPFGWLYNVAVDNNNMIVLRNNKDILRFSEKGYLKGSMTIPDGRNMKQCSQSEQGLLIVDSSWPSFPGRIIQVRENESLKDLLTWTMEDKDQYGVMWSVETDGHHLVVVGSKAVCCYVVSPL